MTSPTTIKPARKGPLPSTETIRKRVCLMIGSGNVDRLEQEGYVVIPVHLLTALTDFASKVPAPEPTALELGAAVRRNGLAGS